MRVPTPTTTRRDALRQRPDTVRKAYGYGYGGFGYRRGPFW
jgi:hypothetical protein